MRLQTEHTESITGTSIRTPTTVARAAPEPGPKRAMAVATASSKKLLAPINAPGAAIACGTRNSLIRPYVSEELKYTWMRMGIAIRRTWKLLLGDVVGLEGEDQHQRGEQRDHADRREAGQAVCLEPRHAAPPDEPASEAAPSTSGITMKMPTEYRGHGTAPRVTRRR